MRGGVPASPATVSWAPLVLTLGLHLLLVLAWLLRPGVQAPPPAPGERQTTLVMLAAPPRAAPAVVPRPTLPPRLAPRVRTPTTPTQPPAADTSEAQPIPAPVEAVKEAAMDATSEATSEATSAPVPGALLASARRMAGRVDRELGNGASALGAAPERKWERFADTVASARIDTGSGVSLDSYVAPDGVTVYRKTVGNRVRCYRSGSVGGLVGSSGTADGHSAGNIACPTGVRWTRL